MLRKIFKTSIVMELADPMDDTSSSSSSTPPQPPEPTFDVRIIIPQKFNWLSLVIDNYLRQEKKEQDSDKTNGKFILSDINQVLCMFCQDMIQREFHRYPSNLFELTKNNTIITPIEDDGKRPYQLSSYLIYPSPNGFTDGIHKWAVKYSQNNEWFGFRSIGVTTVLYDDEQWDQESESEDLRFPKGGSCYDGSDRREGYTWKPGETMEVILNLETKMISYYKVTESSKLIKLRENGIFYKRERRTMEDLLKRTKAPKLPETYYFVLSISADYRCGVFQSVMPITITEK